MIYKRHAPLSGAVAEKTEGRAGYGGNVRRVPKGGGRDGGRLFIAPELRAIALGSPSSAERLDAEPAPSRRPHPTRSLQISRNFLAPGAKGTSPLRPHPSLACHVSVGSVVRSKCRFERGIVMVSVSVLPLDLRRVINFGACDKMTANLGVNTVVSRSPMTP